MRYLLDTCMLVALLQRELGSERIREKILLAPSGSLAISAISAAEIWRGIGQSRHSKAAKLAFEALLRRLRVVPFDRDAAREAFNVHRYLDQTGQQIGRMDPLIAGHAHALGLVCVTDNTRHFIRISGLTLENWLRP